MNRYDMMNFNPTLQSEAESRANPPQSPQMPAAAPKRPAMQYNPYQQQAPQRPSRQGFQQWQQAQQAGGYGRSAPVQPVMGPSNGQPTPSYPRINGQANRAMFNVAGGKPQAGRYLADALRTF